MKVYLCTLVFLAILGCTRSKGTAQSVAGDNQKSKDMMDRTGQIAADAKAYSDCMDQSQSDNPMEDCKVKPAATPEASSTPE